MSKFVRVTDPSHLFPTVEARLPETCSLLNQIKSFHKFKDDLEILTYGENSTERLWILTKYYRKDYGVWISISAPSEQHCKEMSEDIKQSLLSGEAVKWEEKFFLCSLQNHVSKLILNLVLNDVGSSIVVHPCYLFHMTAEEALQIELCPPSGVEVKRLHPDSGTSFIANNWHYRKEGTSSMVRKGIERLPSVGVYVDGSEEPVCGAFTPGFGLIGMLHTDPEHRRKGYASLAMHFIFKEMAKEGLQPCLIAELDNVSAVNFHRSLGLSQVTRGIIMGNTLV